MSEIPGSDIRETDDEFPEYGDISKPFDYVAFCERIRSGHGTAIDHNEFTIRAMQMYILAIYRDEQPEKWVQQYFADQFLKILNGGLWCDELPLPWVPQSEIWTRAEKQAIDIFCDIANTKRLNPKTNITELIHVTAKNHSVSYETARAGYYEGKRRWEIQFPDKTLY